MILLTTLLSAVISLCPGDFAIVTPSELPGPVNVAVKALQRDFGKVLGYAPECMVQPQEGKRSIYVVDQEISPDFCDRELDGFESHRVYVKDGNIYLYGKDMRGTIYAIYTFSEEVLGVPPLWYYSHWTPQMKQEISVDGTLDIFYKSPDVRFRAWFPNDQDLNIKWMSKSKERRLMWLEMMLRLKLNCVEKQETVNYKGEILNTHATDLKEYGLVMSGTHTIVCNSGIWAWDKYWEHVKGTSAPKLSVKKTSELREFWTHAARQTVNTDMECIWQIAFRGATDGPFWISFADSPRKESERGRIIGEMLAMQMDIIREVCGDNMPWIKLTLYDEMSDLMAKGHLKLPEGDRIIWNYCSARRDHYPNKDIMSFDRNAHNVKLGYYMNLQFTSSGCHLAAGESPWKMEKNFRVAAEKGDLVFGVVNSGNIREFLVEESAFAAMMWDMDSYDSDSFLKDFAAQYFSSGHAEEISALYKKYYYSYWQQKKSVFPGIDRQYIFGDLRYIRALDQAGNRYFNGYSNPFYDDGFEKDPGRTFRIDDPDPVNAIIRAMPQTAMRFADVAAEADAIALKIPECNRPFFRDMMVAPSHFMHEMSLCLYHFMNSYVRQDGKSKDLGLAIRHFKNAKRYMFSTQSGNFEDWYDGDRIFGFQKRIDMMEGISTKIAF